MFWTIIIVPNGEGSLHISGLHPSKCRVLEGNGRKKEEE